MKKGEALPGKMVFLKKHIDFYSSDVFQIIRVFRKSNRNTIWAELNTGRIANISDLTPIRCVEDCRKCIYKRVH